MRYFGIFLLVAFMAPRSLEVPGRPGRQRPKPGHSKSKNFREVTLPYITVSVALVGP